jgi:RsiW-degrading membrane proteinase PrsW (M82 family)
MTWGHTGATPAVAPSRAAADVARQVSSSVGLPPAARPRNRGLLVLGILAIALAAIVLLVVALYVALSLGPVATLAGGLMALVPLAIVLAGVRWIDRWDPEPRGILAFSFLWGAGVAVLVAVGVGLELDDVFASRGIAPSEFLASVVQAPLLEEGAKGLGLLLVFLVARRHFDGPVDGVVYAAWIAGGFAFTENILYFGVEVQLAGGIDQDVVSLFFVRGLMSPYAHVMFTACTGLALGFAARRASALASVGVFLLGLVPAILLHALWNGALQIVPDFLGYYAIVQVPLFVGGIVLVVYLRSQEEKLTYLRLSEYAGAGWFSPGEVVSLATGTGRRQARSWALSRGVWPIMRRYTRDATRLAFTRQRILVGRHPEAARVDERELLTAIVDERALLQAALSRR